MEKPQPVQLERAPKPMMWSPYTVPLAPMPRVHSLLAFIFKCEAGEEGEEEKKVVIHRVHALDRGDAMLCHERDPLCASHKTISVTMEY